MVFGRMRVRVEEETLATSKGEDVIDYEVNKHMNGASPVRGERANKYGSLIGLREGSYHYRVIE